MTDGRSPKQEEQIGTTFQRPDWSEANRRSRAEWVANGGQGGAGNGSEEFEVQLAGRRDNLSGDIKK